MRRRFSKSASYFIKIALLYATTFLIILPYFCQDAPHSVYYRKSVYGQTAPASVRMKNSLRLRKATNYLHAVDPDYSRTFYENKLKCPHLQILIVVVTMLRNSNMNPSINAAYPLGYLTQVTAALDSELQKTAGDCDVGMIICNTHRPFENHFEAAYLSKYFVEVEAVHKWRHLLTGKVKERHDKVACFQESLKYNFDYLIVIEDDALPKKNFIGTLQHVLKHKMESMTVRGNKVRRTPRWGYLNLHFPEEWQGYSQITRHYFELGGIGIMGGALFLGLPFFNSRSKARQMLTFAFGSLYFILLVFAIGRQYFLRILSPFPDLHWLIDPGPGCCTPATLYPRIHLPKLVEYLDESPLRYGTDLIIRDFSTDFDLDRMLLVPNLFDHIGLFSTLNRTRDASYYV